MNPAGSFADASSPGEVSSPEEEVPRSVPVPLPWWQAVYQSVAFAFSALLSPYLVIPASTVGIVMNQPASKRQLILWTALSIFFSTFVTAAYVSYQVFRGVITDVHVAEREQRSGPFTVAVWSSAAGALVLYLLHAPSQVWSIGVVLAVNGVVLWLITAYRKISLHVAVLSASVQAAVIMIPGVNPWLLISLIPMLIWARMARGRHTWKQCLAGCLVASVVTAATLKVIQWAVH